MDLFALTGIPWYASGSNIGVLIAPVAGLVLAYIAVMAWRRMRRR